MFLKTLVGDEEMERLMVEGIAFAKREVRIPTMAITYSDLMAITIPSDADRRRSEATLSCSYHAEVIAISQSFCF